MLVCFFVKKANKPYTDGELNIQMWKNEKLGEAEINSFTHHYSGDIFFYAHPLRKLFVLLLSSTDIPQMVPPSF